MHTSKYNNITPGTWRELSQSLWTTNGSVLVYLVVVLLIFGMLGVTMVSLFTTATSSSATPNDARRAFYLAESAVRFAASELRNTGFDTDTIDRLNNTAAYTLDTGQTFSVNVFGPWFDAAADGVSNPFSLTVPEGKIPSTFSIPNGLWVINYDYLESNINLTSARDPISSWTPIDDTTLTITTTGNFTVSKDDRICLAVLPKEASTTLIEGDDANNDLYIERAAIGLFPQFNGAVNINRFDYVYERLEDDPANDRALLVNLSASPMPNTSAPPSDPITNPSDSPYSGDFIVLSPRNHIVIPTGTSDTVTVGGTLADGLNVADTTTVEPSSGADIVEPTDFSQIETNSSFINVNVDKTIAVGGGEGIKDLPEFGSAWFNADQNIGGKQNVCNVGACEFGRGVRVFFTLDYDGVADGLTFALINAAHNTASSTGGDRLMGELLGYGGDSRKIDIPKDSTVNAADFLDGTGEGLQPPKIALEFDTWTNRNEFAYCNGTTKVNSNRNDPFDSNRDAVHFVFWGFTSLAMPCRDYWLSGTKFVDHGSYDDNQHDSGELEQPWTPYTTWGDVRSTPAVAADGTIYVGSDDGHLYAINQDGSLKWRSVDLGAAVHSSPAISPTGVVYVGTENNWVYAFDKDSGAVLDSFGGFGAFRSSPVVGAGGNVYIGSEDGKFYGLTPNLTKEWEFQAAGPISYGRPALSPAGIIYLSHRADINSRVYALNPAQRESDPTGAGFVSGSNNEWVYDVGDGCQYMPGVDPTTGNIYSDRSGNRIVAILPDGVTADWEFDLGSDVDSTPVAGPDGTVYFGADNWNLYAINPADRKADLSESTLNSSREWSFPTGGPMDSIPAIAPDGTILVISDDDNLYAVNPDGTEKWTFPIPVDAGGLMSSPTVGNEGVVYVGSSDNNLYAINNFAEPRNFKDKVVTAVYDGTDTRVAGEIVTVGDEQDWLNGDSSATDPKGPWAVRMEVMRSLTQNPDSKYEYTLHAWIRQCDSVACGNILGTYYEDTRVEYSAVPHLNQVIELGSTSTPQHTDFTRFLFGFTGATGAGTYESAVIAKLKLSFIRPNDPVAP